MARCRCLLPPPHNRYAAGRCSEEFGTRFALLNIMIYRRLVMMNRFAVLSSAVVAALASAALAQVVYEPVRYQYGQYNEVYYGGTNPSFASNNYVYLPQALQAAYAARRMNAPGGLYQYTPYGP